MIHIHHSVRTGKAAAGLPVPVGDYNVGSVSNSRESATGNWMRGQFSHSSSVNTWRTLSAASGYKQPASPFQEYFCISCAPANARSRGPTHTPCPMRMTGNVNVVTTPYLRDASSSSTSSD